MFLRISDRLQIPVASRQSTLGREPGTVPLLPNEPRLTNVAFEQTLTERYLLPALAELEAFFLELRHSVDPLLLQSRPQKLGKPYPLGQCLEITLAVGRLLELVAAAPMAGAAATGQAALLGFIAAGGTLRQVWGDLRGQFFQNAFLLGSLYVDVSNDSVVPTKPKVEILPFAESGLRPIADFAHFQRIAGTYWNSQFFPNHAFPELAPFCPLLRLTSQGQLYLCEPNNYMMALTLGQQFRPSEAMLRAPLLPQALFDRLQELAGRKRKGSVIRLAGSPQEGRRRALELCQRYRARHWNSTRIQDNPLLKTVLATTQQLRLLQPEATPTAGEQSTATVTETHLLLCRQTHARHHWLVPRHFGFSAADMLVPLTGRELDSAALSMPTAFVAVNNEVALVGLQGLNPGCNLLVDAAGVWRNAHLPEAYRCYPFAVVPRGDTLALCILQTSCLPEPLPDTAPLFDKDGAPSAKVLEVVEFLTQSGRNRVLTSQLCAQLQAHALLQPWPIAADATSTLQGLLQVDAAALKRLSQEAVLELEHSGALHLANCQLQSQQHVAILQQLAATRAPAPV